LSACGPICGRVLDYVGWRLGRDEQACLDLQADRFSKGFMHRAAGQNLRLLLGWCWWWLLGGGAAERTGRHNQRYNNHK
jgi:hypothetical protein